MLSAQQIREITFSKSLGGYKTNEVDQFIDNVAATVEELTAKQQEDREKMEVLASKLLEYRAQEENIQNTMLNAQRSADSLMREAKQSAELTIQDAEIKKNQAILDMERLLAEKQEEQEKMLADLTAEYAQKEADIRANYAEKEAAQAADFAAKEQELVELKDRVVSFRDELLAMYKKHLKLIDMLPGEKAPSAEEKAEPIVEEETPAEWSSAEEQSTNENDLSFLTKGSAAESASEEKTADLTSRSDLTFRVPAVSEKEALDTADSTAESVEEESVPATNNDDSVSPVHASQTIWPDDEVETLPADKEDRFADLKFGNNYDVGGASNPFDHSKE